jgi:hypothetical protein
MPGAHPVGAGTKRDFAETPSTSAGGGLGFHVAVSRCFCHSERSDKSDLNKARSIDLRAMTVVGVISNEVRNLLLGGPDWERSLAALEMTSS